MIDSDGPKRMWIAVLRQAFHDLRHKRECPCAQVDELLCVRCQAGFHPTEQESACAVSNEGEGYRHLFECVHSFKTARRFLVGTHGAWESHAQMVCHLVGVERDLVKSHALEVLGKRRKRDAA